MAQQQGPPEVNPTTIFRHAFAVYTPMAMLAGMQLDVFTPLKDGPMTGLALAGVLGVRPDKLQPLLYALVNAELLTVEEDRFANTPEADFYLVRGRAAYMGSAHELYADLWSAALGAARSIRAGVPQAKHDFAAMPDEELAAFFRGLHAGALATGRQLAENYCFERFRNLLDVGGGSGGLAIAACRSCPDLRATVVELPRVAPIARSFVEEAGLADRVRVLPADVVEHPQPKVRAWLARHPRWTFHFTPTSCSWLNAVETFFATLAKRTLKRGAFRSVVDLQATINRYLAETNRDPKPFVWTADPGKIIAAVSRGRQALDSIH